MNQEPVRRSGYVRWTIICGVVAMGSLHSALAQTKSLELQVRDGKTLAVSAPQSLAGKETLSVICGDGVNCLEIRASTSTGTTLDPSASPAPSRTQTTFALPETLKPGSTVAVRVCAAGASAASCLQNAAVAEIPVKQAGTMGQSTNGSNVLRFCSDMGRNEAVEITRARGGADFTVILFDDSGPCYLSRQFGAEGDPIAVGFVSTADAAVSLNLDPCSTLSATPKVLIPADTSAIDLRSAEEPDRPQVRWFPPLRRCFGTAVGITLTVEQDGKPKPLAYTLKQFERYRATLQIGAGASTLHQRAFGLRPAGTAKQIIETSAAERGPEYVASVVLYGVPHYFSRRTVTEPRFLERESDESGARVPRAPGARPQTEPPSARDAPHRAAYFGRDPVNENGAMDRIGLLLGAGLSQPGRRFLVGGSLELMTGVNLFLAREFVRTPELEGFAVGDEFSGEAAALPLRDHWRTAWTAGLSLDARYALALFGRK